MLRALLRLIDGVCAAGAGLAALSLALLAAMLIAEVVATSFLAWSQPWAVEYAGYLLAATLFAGSGWALRHGGHIRVQVATDLMPAPARRLADLLATAFALGVAGLMTWACLDTAIRSFERGSLSYYPTATPLAWPQSVLAFGMATLALALLARLMRLLIGEAPEAPAPAPAASGEGA